MASPVRQSAAEVRYATGGATYRYPRPLHLLKPVDTAQGHWVLDERNGILLDEYWLGGKLTSVFSLGGVTITNSHAVEGDRMTIEFTTTSSKPVQTTGLGTEDSPRVDSYAVRSYQKAVLHRQGQAPPASAPAK